MDENELLRKWKMVLDYTSHDTLEIPDSDLYLKTAKRLEYFENLYCKYPHFLKKFIPMVRRFFGEIELIYGMVQGDICVITKGLDNYSNVCEVAIPMNKIDDITSCSYVSKGYYAKINDTWQWI